MDREERLAQIVAHDGHDSEIANYATHEPRESPLIITAWMAREFAADLQAGVDPTRIAFLLEEMADALDPPAAEVLPEVGTDPLEDPLDRQAIYISCDGRMRAALMLLLTGRPQTDFVKAFAGSLADCMGLGLTAVSKKVWSLTPRGQQIAESLKRRNPHKYTYLDVEDPTEIRNVKR